MDYTFAEIANMIDHSLLTPTLTDIELEAGCRVALEYRVAGVCIMPYYLARCAAILKGSSVRAGTVIGFPHGVHTSTIKAAEARQALDDGGEELDMVVNISKVLSEDWDFVRQDIGGVVDLAHERGQKVKVIFENCYLSESHKIRLCQICTELETDWVKTSTGYGSSGADIKDLELMREHTPESIQVKAAGGIRTLDTVLEMRAIGVSRIGASRTAEILEECKRRLGE